MKIGKRYFLTLKEIVENSDNITGKELESKFHLTRKQLSYGIGKINEYLESCGYAEITRASNGKINVPQEVVNEVDLAELERENQEICFSKEERIDILHLMLLTSKEELSLQHFISELKVSKNTVLADLKKLDNALPQNQLGLSYGRQNGYTLSGSEYAKRQLLITTLGNIIIQYKHAPIVAEICGLGKAELAEMRALLTNVQEALGIRFVGEMLEANSYLFAILFRRIEEGLTLDEVPEDLHLVGETWEYNVVKGLTESRKIASDDEVMYLTAYIQGTKLESARWVRDAVNEFRLRRAVRETIENYEKFTGITINEKDELENLLVHHCGPALYRIRYDFHIGLDITKYVLPAYQSFHELVRKSAGPLEALAGNKIPEKELVYITLIIVSFTMKEGMSVEDLRPRAIVVCQNGITVSRVLLSLLKELFPGIRFVKCMSAGQFTGYGEPYDMVFSTIALPTGQKLYVIDPLMDEKQRKNLREKVLKDFQDGNVADSGRDEVIKMASGFMDGAVHLSSQQARNMEQGKLHLKDILKGKHIRVMKEPLEWQEAVEFAAVPLLYDHSIQIRYVKAVIDNIIKNRPYLVIADGVVVAHAGISDGVNDVGISIMVLPEIIPVFDYLEAKVIIVLATPDYERHLTALNELILILEDDKKLRKIKNAKKPEDILGLL